MSKPKHAPQSFAYKSGGRITLDARAEADTAELTIYGYIGETWWEESVTAKNVIAALDAMSARELTVRIMSSGGSVADGVAIYNALRRKALAGTKVITRNEGNAYSIASVILMAGDEVQSYANATVMVHAPWTYAEGDAATLRNVAEYLDKLAEGVATSYARKTGKGEAHALALMQNGKDNFFTAAEAVAEGFVDVLLDELPGTDEDPQPMPPQQRTDLAAAFAAHFPDLQQMPRASWPQIVVSPLAAARGSTPEQHMSAPNPAPAPSPAVTEPKADPMAAHKARVAGIRAAFAALGDKRKQFSPLEADCLADDTVTVEMAGTRVIEALATEQAATPTGGTPKVEAGKDAKDHFRAGLINALQYRANPGSVKLDDNGRQYQGMNLVRMAEAACAMSNVRTGHLPREIAAKALHSTDDFPFVLENVITKTLRQAYEATQRTFTPFSRRATLPDFKTVSRVQLAGAPQLLRVVEGGEYEMGTIGEGAERYSVQKYGRRLAITWETIINDDLSAFTRLPEMFGRSAADLESDLVYRSLIANANMGDGNALFSAAHGNVGTGGAISETTLSEARELMLLQKGIEGQYITVRPEFLIVPPRLLTTAQKVLTAVMPNATSGVNVFQNALQIIVEPRLQDNAGERGANTGSATAWYLAANPAQIDTIEYAYLEGYEGVFTETRNGFEVDGLEVKCRHVFGCKAIDWRGLFRNAGA